MREHRHQLFLERDTRFATACREAVGALLHLCEDFVHLLHEAADAVVETVGILKLSFKILLNIEQGGNGVNPVFLLKTVDKVKPLVHLGLPLGRILNPVVEACHLREYVLHLDKAGVEPGAERFNSVVIRGHLLQGAARSGKARDNPVVLLPIAHDSHSAQGLFDCLGVFEQMRLLFQFVLFVGIQMGSAQLVVEKEVIVACLVVLGILGGKFFQFVFQCRILPI